MKWMLILAIALIGIGIIGLVATDYYYSNDGSSATFRDDDSSSQDRGYGPGNRRRDLRAPSTIRPDSQNFKTNGERIFMTGVSSRGEISRTGGPGWLQRQGGGCAACHGVDGRGGQPTMMQSISAPDIRYSELRKEFNSDQLIKRAVVQGRDEENRPLEFFMPRWAMSDADFNDLLAHLKTLDS